MKLTWPSGEELWILWIEGKVLAVLQLRGQVLLLQEVPLDHVACPKQAKVVDSMLQGPVSAKKLKLPFFCEALWTLVQSL